MLLEHVPGALMRTHRPPSYMLLSTLRRGPWKGEQKRLGDGRLGLPDASPKWSSLPGSLAVELGSSHQEVEWTAACPTGAREGRVARPKFLQGSKRSNHVKGMT